MQTLFFFFFFAFTRATHLPACLILPAGTYACLPAMFGQTSFATVLVTRGVGVGVVGCAALVGVAVGVAVDVAAGVVVAVGVAVAGGVAVAVGVGEAVGVGVGVPPGGQAKTNWS